MMLDAANGINRNNAEGRTLIAIYLSRLAEGLGMARQKGPLRMVRRAVNKFRRMPVNASKV